MEIDQKLLKQLILEMEPRGFTANILSINGYGSIDSYDSFTWSTNKIMSLDEDGLLKLVKQIAWNG